VQVIDNDIYDRIDSEWWGNDSFMALLRTAINPARFRYFHGILNENFGADLSGVKVLDVGCGGGLLSEQWATLGCKVIGVDHSGPTLEVARAHARASRLSIEYLQASADLLPFDAQRFDVVCCCDVLEHVEDVGKVIAEISRVLRPGGVFFFDTINRTIRSKLIAIKLAQDCSLTRFVPNNVHVFENFIRPSELASHLSERSLSNCKFVGLSPSNPLQALVAFVELKLKRISFEQFGNKITLNPSKDLSISYMGFAILSTDT
jgi:2-polyprenyl-6-hydroxyphenyl methylase / 3-demethylubiquinone-9 3-methyltransferase